MWEKKLVDTEALRSDKVLKTVEAEVQEFNLKQALLVSSEDLADMYRLEI